MSEKNIVQILAAARFKSRSDTLENWEKENPVLLSGEPGVVTDGTESEKIKFGDGVTPWNELGWWKGPKGEKGDIGPQGEPGKDGIDAIASAIINENKELIITYSNGTTNNLGVVVGEQGNAGINGNDGQSVIMLDTRIRTYSTASWKEVGAYGTTDYWGDVANASELKIGDIGILRGKNSDTDSDVLLINEITAITIEDETGKVINRVNTRVKACIQGIVYEKKIKYHKIRDAEVKFQLERNHMYSFTVKDNNTTKVSIVDNSGNTVVGIANNALSGMTSGMIICSDRCSITGLTGNLSITNLNAYISDRWDWSSTYYLVASDTTGVDIWDM